MSKDQTDWKHKYKEAAIELERYESSQVEEQMRLIISHMTLGLQGQSESLDSALSHIRQTLASASNSLDRKSIAELEKQVRYLDREREKTAKSMLVFLKQWLLSLKKVADEEQQADFLLLERKASEVVDHWYEVPEYLSSLLALQESHLQEPGATHVVSPLADSLSADVPQDVVVKDEASVDSQFEAVASELIQLVDALSLSADHKQRVALLIKRIRTQLSFGELVSILAELIELVQISTSSAHEDFEQYLISLNSQLAAVQGFLSESQSDQSISGKAQKALDSQVRQEVSNIHTAVNQSTSLDDLKVTVASQLDGIVFAMDEFRKSEEERESRSQQRHDELMQQMQSMEEESRRVKAHMEEERMKARTDSLTGLPNRAAYDDHLKKEFERWSRYQQGFSIAIGDLDHFKSINDNYGHLVGDKVLRLVSRVLSKTLRAADFIARYGGEEFIILLPATSISDATGAIDKLRASVCNSPFNFHGEPVQITMSFGVAETKTGDTLDQLFERADAALYRAKGGGRNCVRQG